MSLFDKTNKVTPASVSSQLLASGDPSGTWASSKGHAVWIRPSSPLIGKTIDSITWTLKNANGTTGSLDFGVWGSYGNTSPVQSFGSISESTLTTSFADYTLTFTPYTIQEGDYIGFRTSSDGINSMVTASASVPSVYTDYHASTWWNNGLGGAYGWDTYPNTGGGNLSSSNNTNSVAFGISRKFMGQRVVENFSGSVLDTDRWAYRDLAGIGSSGMSDSVNGGFFVKTATTTGTSQIDFNDIRQFSHTGSVFIGVLQKVTATNALLDSGLITGITHTDTNTASVNIDTRQTYIRLNTGDASANTRTDTDVAIHSNMTSVKIECKAGDIELSLDGVLKATKTTNRPTLKMQPYFRPTTLSTPLTEGDIRYMECYNT